MTGSLMTSGMVTKFSLALLYPRITFVEQSRMHLGGGRWRGAGGWRGAWRGEVFRKATKSRHRLKRRYLGNQPSHQKSDTMGSIFPTRCIYCGGQIGVSMVLVLVWSPGRR